MHSAQVPGVTWLNEFGNWITQQLMQTCGLFDIAGLTQYIYIVGKYHIYVYELHKQVGKRVFGEFKWILYFLTMYVLCLYIWNFFKWM
jgi:hypothetical protein